MTVHTAVRFILCLLFHRLDLLYLKVTLLQQQLLVEVKKYGRYYQIWAFQEKYSKSAQCWRQLLWVNADYFCQ